MTLRNEASQLTLSTLAVILVSEAVLQAGHGPPQSIPVSPWFCMPSLHVACGVDGELLSLSSFLHDETAINNPVNTTKQPVIICFLIYGFII